MTINHADYNPDLKYGATQGEQKLAVTEGSIIVGDSSGLGSELDVSTDAQIIVGNGTTAVSVALSGQLAITNAGVATVTGGKTGVVSGTDATVAVTVAQSGTVFFATATSGTQTYTLPAVAAGLTYTFIAAHAGGEILVDQAASEVITITTFAAVGADADTAIVAPAGGTGVKNTAATNAVGDSLTLVSDGTGWYGVGITSGIWASQ